MRKETVVAIPVRDEEKRIGNCLAALSRQTIGANHLILLLNNCTDNSAVAINCFAQSTRYLHVIQCSLPAWHASAGVARSMAMDLAATLVDDGVILTTDADAEVPENWIESNLAAIEAGADAVCGMAVIDPFEALMIPAHLHEDDAREVAYGQLLDEIESVILPDAADPWPRHTEDSGASIAVSTPIFRRVGGMPCIAAGEDRGLIRSLRGVDARVRHDPSIKVIVSGRFEGRAQGGMADTIRRRMVQQDEFTDERIESALAAFRRFQLKRRFKALREKPNEPESRLLARRLAIYPEKLGRTVHAAHFGTGWHLIEQESPILKRERIRFQDLPRETSIARRILNKLKGDRSGETCSVACSSMSWSARPQNVSYIANAS